MINFFNSTLLFVVLLIISIGLDIYSGLSPIIYLVLYLLYSGVFFYGVFTITSNFFINVACAADTLDKVIAISFDDGPSVYTPEILKILQKYQVQAAFFCIGQNISDNEELIKSIHQQGHMIGNHSFSHHLLFDFYSSKRMSSDLQKMDDALYSVIGLKPKLFRPPFGVINPSLTKAIRQGRYLPVGWSVRSLDTVIRQEQKLLQKVIAALQPGAIYLFHDTQLITQTILPIFIEHALAHGYQLVRLDKLMNIPAYCPSSS